MTERKNGHSEPIEDRQVLNPDLEDKLDAGEGNKAEQMGQLTLEHEKRYTHEFKRAADILNGREKPKSLNNLTTARAVVELAEHEHMEEIDLSGIQEIDPQCLKLILDFPGTINLDGLTEISDKMNADLMMRKGKLILGNPKCSEKSLQTLASNPTNIRIKDPELAARVQNLTEQLSLDI